MFTDFLGGVVVKPGFSKWPFLPPPTSASIQYLYKEVGHFPIGGFNDEYVGGVLRSAPGDWSKHPALLRLLDYSFALAASNGPGKITSTRRKRLVGMKYGGLDHWH